jgi:hypothetical protein
LPVFHALPPLIRQNGLFPRRFIDEAAFFGTGGNVEQTDVMRVKVQLRLGVIAKRGGMPSARHRKSESCNQAKYGFMAARIELLSA